MKFRVMSDSVYDLPISPLLNFISLKKWLNVFFLADPEMRSVSLNLSPNLTL